MTTQILKRPEAKLRKPRPVINHYTDLQAIWQKITDNWGYTLTDLSKPCRKREIVYIRQAVMYMLRYDVKPTRSMHYVGNLFNMNHCSADHSKKVINLAKQGYNPELLYYYNVLKSVI